jgi:hypothetical protein
LFGWKTDCWCFICSKFASKWNESFNCMICVLLYNQAFSFSLDRQGYNWLLTNPSLNPPSGFLYLLSFHDLAISLQINIFKFVMETVVVLWWYIPISTTKQEHNGLIINAYLPLSWCSCY